MTTPKPMTMAWRSIRTTSQSTTTINRISRTTFTPTRTCTVRISLTLPAHGTTTTNPVFEPRLIRRHRPSYIQSTASTQSLVYPIYRFSSRIPSCISILTAVSLKLLPLYQLKLSLISRIPLIASSTRPDRPTTSPATHFDPGDM